MSKAPLDAIEIEDMRLGWEEVADIAGYLFIDECDDSDGFSWAKFAWQVLSEAGLDRYVLEVERIVCIIRFVALFALYSEFCARAFADRNPGDWEYVAPAGLIGDYPFVDSFSLGQLAQQRDMFIDNYPSRVWDARGEVITLLAQVEYREILNVLQDRWGKEELFAALYASRVRDGRQGASEKDARDWYDAGASIKG